MFFPVACILGAGVCLLVSALYTGYLIESGDTAYLRDLEAKTESQALDVSQRLGDQFRGINDMAQAIADQPSAVELLRHDAGESGILSSLPPDRRRARLAADPETAAMSDYYSRIIDEKDFDSVSLYDRQGICVANSNWRTARSILGDAFGDRKYFQDAITTGVGRGFAVSRPARIPSFFHARAVRAKEGVLGAAVIRTFANSLGGTLASAGNQTLVVDPSGVIVASNRPDFLLRQVALWRRPDGSGSHDQVPGPLRPLDIRALAGAGAIHLVTWDGARFLVASHGLPKGPLTVWVAAPLEDRRAEHRRLVAIGALAAGAGLLMVLVIFGTIERGRLRRDHAAQLAHSNWALTEANERLTAMSRTDSLTGAANRRHFVACVAEGVALARRSDLPCTLLLLDLDHFKSINDNHGHPVGDAVLAQVAKACLHMTRATDSFGRVGGEEFGFFLWDTDAAGGRCLAERLRAAIEALEISQGDVPIRITASVGVAEFKPEEDFEGAYARADAALYSAKSAGRNQVVIA